MLAQIQRGESENVYLKVVDRDPSDDGSGTGNIIAWADWMLPEDESAPKSSGALRGRPPPGVNLQFCGMVSDAVRAMRTRVLQGKKCYGKSNDCLLSGEYLSIQPLQLMAYLSYLLQCSISS